MAKNETSFEEGHDKPGPGRPKLSELEREARDAAREEIANAYMATRGKTVDELDTIARSKVEPAIMVLMAANMIKGITTGDWALYDKQLDRIIGKTKQAVELTGKGGGVLEITISQELDGF